MTAATNPVSTSVSPGRRVWLRFKCNRLGYWSFIIFMVMFVFSLGAELLGEVVPAGTSNDDQATKGRKLATGVGENRRKRDSATDEPFGAADLVLDLAPELRHDQTDMTSITT